MSRYSEMIGSFIRTGNFPMEAHYIFATESELKEFYADPVNNATLHKGLLRVVENDGSGQQALYWVTKKLTNDELEFKKLIVNLDVDTIYSSLQDLLNRLNTEIQERKDSDTAIWGTTDSSNIPEELNSILDISNAVANLILEVERIHKELIDSDDSILKSLKTELKATVGTADNNIVEYLKTLPYQSLTEVSNALNKFLNQLDDSTTKINTLPELLNFLEGYTDSDKLSKLLDDLWNKLEGTPLPTEEFRTLRAIEDFIRPFMLWTKDRTDNLQTELDLTQVGVGLSGDGSYNPDKETNYLLDATSVMNALKILDGLMKEAILGITITPDNKDVVDLSVRKELEGYVIAAKLLLSNAFGNELIKKEDGLYMNVVSEYKDGVLTLKVNDQIVALHVLGFSALVETALYDPSLEAIVITFKLLNGDKLTVTIPVGALIREWEPDNSIPDKVVELVRETVVDGADKVSADVRLVVDPTNILRKRGNALIVEGISSNITHNGQAVSEIIEEIKTTNTNLESSLNQEIERAKTAELENASNITNEVNRAKLEELALSNSITNESNRALNKESELDASILANKDSIEKEIQRATTSEEGINSTLLEHILDKNNPHEVTKQQVGLGNVDNTSDQDKPVSTALAGAIKQVLDALDAHVTREDNPHNVTKELVGLGSVENIAPADMPISSATLEELDKKAPIDSPTFTGIPLIESSPDAEDSSLRIPSTNWVKGRIEESIGDTKEKLDNHINDLNNPHRVTAELVGAYSTNQVDEKLNKKADLVDGKITIDQLPASTILWIEVE